MYIWRKSMFTFGFGPFFARAEGDHALFVVAFLILILGSVWLYRRRVE
jgi:hypothetical protein